MSDAEILNLIDYYRLRVEPLTDGGWMVEMLDHRKRFMRLALRSEPSVRDAIRQAIGRLAEMAREN